MEPPWHLVLVFISFFENCYGLRCAYAAGLSPERLCHGPHGSGVIAPRTLLSLGLGLRCPITALALHQHYILPPRGLIASAQTGLNGARLAFTAYQGLFPLHFDLQTKVGYLRARRFPRFIFCGEQNNLSGSMQWQLYWALLSSYLQVNGSFMNGLELCLVRYCLRLVGPSLHLIWSPRTIA